MTKSKPDDDYCKFTNPIITVLNVIEDRIGEILGSGDLDADTEEDMINGLPPERNTAAVEKMRLLKRLSSDLHKFYDGQF